MSRSERFRDDGLAAAASGPRPTPRPGGFNALAPATAGAAATRSGRVPTVRSRTADELVLARARNDLPTPASAPGGVGSGPRVQAPDRSPVRLVKRPRPGYLPALDGLRAVSVAAVVAFHLGRLRGGFIGVDVFFVVSGFLITRLLLAEREGTGRIALGAFWGRRFRRLVPALLVILAGVAVASRAWLPSWRLTGIRHDSLATLAYVANWRFVASGQSYFAQGVGPSPLRHAWSLAIEEQFYVVWPLLVLGVVALARKRHRLLLLVLTSVGALASAGWMAFEASRGVDLSRLYYGTDSRAFALLAGAWVATWWDPVVADAPRPVHDAPPRPLARLAGAALIPLAVLALVGAEDAGWFYRYGFQATAVLAGVAVAGLAIGEGGVARALGSPALRWIGRRSYGIYLWSWPTQVFASEHFHLRGLTLDATVVAVAVGAAALSFRFIEEPIRLGWGSGSLSQGEGRRARAQRPAPGRLALRGGFAVVATAGLVVGCTAGATPAPAYLSVTDAQAASVALAPATGFGRRASLVSDAAPATTAAPTTTATSQVAVAPTSTTVPVPPGPFAASAPVVVDPAAAFNARRVHGRALRVMIAGDSVGWSLGWEPASNLTRSVRIDDRAIIGCGLMPPDSSFVVGGFPAERYSDLCLKQAPAEELGLESRPDVVLLWAGAWEVYDHQLNGQTYTVGHKAYRQELDARIQARIDQFRAAGVPTVISLLPCFGVNAPRLGTERYDRDRIAWVNGRIKEVAARNPTWVRLIDPESTLCTANGQALDATPSGHPLRADGAHFDAEGAAWFWNTWLAGQLGAAFQS